MKTYTAYFEEKQLVIETHTLGFLSYDVKKKKIPYEKIERIEVPQGEYVIFYMKNGKEIKFRDPDIASFYTGFGEMLKKYGIPYKCLLVGEGEVTIENVREEADRVKESARTYVNHFLKEKLGSEYELDAKLVERIGNTTIEFRVRKNGFVLLEANQNESVDADRVVDEIVLAYLCEWDPVREEGKYAFTEAVYDKQECEKYFDEIVLEIVNHFR